MRKFYLLFTLGALAVTSAVAGDTAKDKAIKKDRELYVGKWTVVALEINGNKSNEEDARKITVVNGVDGTWSIQVSGNDIANGTSTIDPTKKPKTINFTPTVGLEAGKEYLGIYEIGAKK